MQLTFTHCSFPLEQIVWVEREDMKPQGWRPGQGCEPLYLIRLASGATYQISPDQIAYSGQSDPYYRDKDASYSCIKDLAVMCDYIKAGELGPLKNPGYYSYAPWLANVHGIEIVLPSWYVPVG